MNHEKAIEEVAKALNDALFGVLAKDDDLRMIHDVMRSLVSTILRAESQRVDTEPFHQVIVRRCHACGEDIPAIGPDFCGICLLTNPQPESEVKPCDNQDAYVEIPASAPAEPEGRLPSNAAPDVPSEGVPPACHNHYSDGTKIFPNRDCCTPQPVEPERQEQCEWCGCLTTDWLDTDWSRGRICRACEDKHDPAKAQPVEPAAEKIGEQQSTLSVKDLLALDAEIHSLLASLAQQQSDSLSQSGLKVSQVQMLAALIRSFGKVEPAASGTPETDATKKWTFGDNRPGMSFDCVTVDFARDLEQRLRASEAERKRLIPLAYETRPGMAIGPVTWQECYKHALKSYYDTQGERDAALARVAKLEGAFNKYATHKDDCQIITVAFGYRVQNCTCGFDTALQP